MASRKRSRGRWSEWSIRAGAGWASGRACEPAWRPGWGSLPCTKGSGRVRPRGSAGAWSWPRSHGTAGDRGYRRRASLLGRVEGKAGDRKKGAKTGLGRDSARLCKRVVREPGTQGLRGRQTGAWREAGNLQWAGCPYLCGLGSASPSDV